MWHTAVNHRNPTAALLALLLCIPAAVQAEFVLNFQPQLSRTGPEWINFNCHRPNAPGGNFSSCDENDEFRSNNGRDTTPFLMELVREPITTQLYYHTIIGLPGDDFVQEVYIKVARNGQGEDQGPISDSLGNWTQITNGRDNAFDPLGPASFSGSGTANPKSTQFRQVIDSNGLYQEITKASYNKKHRIVHNLDTGEMVHKFEMDMTNSTFDQANIVGILIKNEQVVTQGSFSSTFDIHNMPESDRSLVNITGGKYLFARKYTTSMSGGPFENEYSGEGSGFNIWLEDWMAWRDPAQNVGHLYGGSGKN